MAFRFVLTQAAREDLHTTDRIIARRIVKKIQWFSAQENPLIYAKTLEDSDAGDVRFRVGDYRLIAIVDSKKLFIVIVKIGHRSKVYR